MVEADLPVCGRVSACSRQILIWISVNRRCKRGEEKPGRRASGAQRRDCPKLTLAYRRRWPIRAGILTLRLIASVYERDP
jgi:hypothetical protein